ncbi:hypothetical protein KR067_010741 [Drosophila pandora]|nr:hypothetical protein KR067_010741 [Drosophila pandora]
MSRFVAIAAVFICLAVILGGQQAQGAIARVKAANPDHPGKCVLGPNSVMSPGQTGKAPNHPCAGVECHGDGHATITTCAAVAPPKGCKLRDFVNTNRDFPACCERNYDCSKHI